MRSNFRKGLAAGAVAAASIGLAVGPALSQAGASSTDGVTSNQITIGATVPLTGIAALGYSDVAKTANAVFNYINAKGGVNGRKINFIIKDDCYDVPGFSCTGNPDTVAQTNALLSTPGGLFATVGSLGTATQDSVRSLLKSNGVPQLFVNSGSKDWDNAGTYPSLFGWQTDYIAEGKIFANYIKTSFSGEKVGYIGQNDDFGQNGLLGLQRGGLSIANMGGTDSYGYNVGDILFGDPFVSMISTLKADNVKVLVLDTIPQATKKVLADAKKVGFKPQFIISGVGSDPQTVNSASEVGALSLTFLPATADASNPWNKWIAKVILADKTDFPKFTAKSILTGNMQYGAGWAVTFLQLVKAMGSNVTQSNAVSTLESQGSTFVTPAVTSLAYSSSNHQGLMGGLMVSVKSVTTTAPVKGNTVYTTDDGNGTPLTAKAYKVTAVPSWLA
jgi:ABC-type branched-subunit amino acid transport system substrate-binding protein